MSRKILAFIILVSAFLLAACSASPGIIPAGEGSLDSQPVPLEKTTPIDWDKQTVQFEHLSIEEGLSQSVVSAMLQDHLGFMWFGTQDGLNRYDGYEFKIFKHDPENPASICNNFIQALYEDKDGIMWVGTFGGGLNRYDPKTEQFTCYLPDEEDPQSISHPTVSSIVPDPDGSLWLGTNGGGLSRFDPVTETFTTFKHKPGEPESLSDDVVLQLAQDRNGMLWVGTMNGGLNQFDPVKGVFTRIDLFNNVQSLRLDKSGRLWLGSVSEGLAWIDTDTMQSFVFPHHPDDPLNPKDTNIHAIFEDRDGVIWIAASMAGLSRLDSQETHFIHYQNDPDDPNSLAINNIVSLYQDQAGIFWFGTFGGGVDRFDPSRRKFQHINNDPKDPDSLIDNNVWAIFEDSTQNLWVGSFNGITKFVSDGSVQHFFNQPENPDSISQSWVFSISQDQEGSMWFGTMSALSRLDSETGRFTNYPSAGQIYPILLDGQNTIWAGTIGFGLAKFDLQQESFTYYSNEPGNDYGISDSSVMSIFKDSQDRLWAGTFAGGLCEFDREMEKFACYVHDPGDRNSISNNVVLDILEGEDGILWVATAGGLNKFNPQDKTFSVYLEKDGLPNELVYAILQDGQHNLWLSTNNGISKFNPVEETFINFSTYDGLQSKEFNQGAWFKSADGEMFFGGLNGFNRFHPADIQINSYQPPLVITRFSLFNDPVGIGQDSPLKVSLPYTPKIVLDYQQKFFSFDFASLHFSDPDRIQYAYQLEGLEEDWNYSGSRRFASYTNVPPGDYRFKVKATNSDGVWNDRILSIAIVVVPPFWQTLWFRLMMVGLVGGVMLAIFELRISMVRKQKQTLELQVAERTQELQDTMLELQKSTDAAEVANRAKSTFLANVSHELRTPLNAILGFSQLVINSKSSSQSGQAVPPEHLKNIEIIHDSGEHLLGLINEVLEMSKIEAGRINIREISFDMIELFNGLEEMFRLRAEEKSLSLIFDVPEEIPRYVVTDEGKLRQILMNLLGNAVKFTEQGGILLAARVRNDLAAGEQETRPGRVFLQIDVTDSGHGIDPQDMEIIFKPFSQAAREQNSEGTGLGLSISREYARLLGGSITAISQLGKGSTFSLVLPVSVTDQLDESLLLASRKVKSVVHGERPTRILIVDDKDVNRLLLNRILTPLGFEVREAENGRAALETWQEWYPHAILMDMRMPVMDGYEATRRIKATTKGQAVVIIAVTASALEEDREMILSEGCDGYIRKPFRETEIFDELEKHLGIQFIYEEIGSDISPVSMLTPHFNLRQALQQMPASHVASLHKAVTAGDVQLINSLLDGTEGHAPELTVRMREMVESYDFDHLLKLLDNANGAGEE